MGFRVIGVLLIVVASGCALVGGLGDYHLASEAGPPSPDGGFDADGSPGVEPTFPSCRGLGLICGGDGGRDCCESNVVEGGAFARSYDGVPGGGFESSSSPATITSFRLDNFEITVGRFRRFVEAYPGSIPARGAGKIRSNPDDPGWVDAWSSFLPSTATALTAALACDAKATWSDAAGGDGDEARPINCLTYAEAFAFCAWDGGRLPTEAEWNYAAAGGNEQRVYPWSVPPKDMTLDQAHAVNGVPNPARVGSTSPTGDGRWGQADLAGNLWEWSRDVVAPYANPCNDCSAGFTSSEPRSVRGGCYGCLVKDLRVVERGSGKLSDPGKPDRGGRCARDP